MRQTTIKVIPVPTNVVPASPLVADQLNDSFSSGFFV
jgi:hypothetical protein